MVIQACAAKAIVRGVLSNHGQNLGRGLFEWRADIQRHFRVSPPSVHQMIVTLERNGFIRRQPGVPRRVEILVPLENLPILEWLGIKTSKSP